MQEKTRFLVIPDLHNCVGWVSRCLSEMSGEYDKVIFLGDYFDSYNEYISDVYNTVSFIKDHIHDENNIFLLGNHDLPYMCINNLTYCPGYTEEKQRCIDRYMTSTDWERFKPIHVEYTTTGDVWAFSHAGLHPSIFLHPINGADINYIINKCEMGRYNVASGIFSDAYQIGKGRGGDMNVGGVLWLDWYTEFIPIPHINQIVGHSYVKYPEQKNISTSENRCIDTGCKYVMLWKDGTIQILTNIWNI